MKPIYLVNEVKVSPSLLQGDFSRTIVDNDQKSTLIKSSNYEKGKKYKLHVTSPVTHGGRLTLNDAVYIPNRLVDSAKSFFDPYPKPIIREHITGANMLLGAAPDAIGRVKFAQYQDRAMQASSFTFKQSLDLVQKLMREGVIYDSSFEGLGAIVAHLQITDQDAIEKFLDERIMTFSVGGRTKEVYSPFNGKHVSDLTDEDLGPYDEYEGMRGFKLVGLLDYAELSTTLTPADVLAKVTSMELQEFHVNDSVSERQHNKMNSNKKFYFVDGLFNLEGASQMTDREYSLKDYCGPENSFPVTSKEEGLAALKELKDSTLPEEVKAKVEKAVKLKLKDFHQKDKNIFVDKNLLSDSIKQLTAFEVLDFVDNLKTSLETIVDKNTLAELLGVEETDSTSKRVLEAELKDAKTKVASLENEVQDLRRKTDEAQKSFVFLAKAIKDNTELTSFEEAAKIEDASVQYEALLKDTSLFEKLEKIFKGSDPNSQVDSNRIPNEVIHNGSQEQPVDVSESAKIYKKLFNEKKQQDGIQKAKKWLQTLKDNAYISEEDFNLLNKED